MDNFFRNKTERSFHHQPARQDVYLVIETFEKKVGNAEINLRTFVLVVEMSYYIPIHRYSSF